MKDINGKLFYLLEKNPGKPLTRKEIDRLIGVDAAKTVRRGRGARSGESDSHEIQMTLAELELLGLVELKGRNYIPTDPFLVRARVSLSPRGLAFATARGADPAARDLFIIPSETKGALTGDEVLLRITGKKRERFEAAVVQIIKRARSFYRMNVLSGLKQNGIPGVILDAPGKISACLSGDRIPSDILRRLRPDTVIVITLTGKRLQYLGLPYLEANFVRFESDTDGDPDTERIFMKYNLDPVYPSSVPLPSSKEAEEAELDRAFRRGERIDLRDLYTVTIDGDDSKDFDDAISLDARGRRWKLYVHIADVSHFVKRNTLLDEEAKRRATSVYLANRVVPMLPPVLSENLCSLVQGKNRMAFTAEMEVDPSSGKIKNYRFYRSVIRVDRRLTYTIAENELDEALSKRENTELSRMWQVSVGQKALRVKEGRIDLNIKEPKLKLREDGSIESITIRDRLKSSMLIEEFMLSANTCVAAFLKKHKAKTLYRVHEEMDPQKVPTLNSFFKIYNIKAELKNTKAASIQKVLELVKKSPGVEPVFNIILLRSFMQANYRGMPLGHWGLAFKDYCHFTSPIRRYPDLVVHRSLSAILDKKEKPYLEEEINDLGVLTSEQERSAMEAERDIVKLKMIRLIERSGTREFSGFITGFRPDRVFLELEEFPVEAIVMFMHLTNDTELILPDEFSAYIKKFSRPAYLGEKWKLRLEKIDIEEIRLYCSPISSSETPFKR
jgi:ribonuclease R